MSDEDRGFNPRYMAYCRACGIIDPEEMLNVDDQRWPGGKMTGYLLWCDEAWRQFFVFHPSMGGEKRGNRETHEAFDAWLAKGEVR